ncbi:dethiobiotin synthase [Pasteurellaceae bacterium HPA106]|uniref:dethiobiotin synthase n=1 Tax=Spirabiliibacterium pneumoniae TaxID=221400 RepID=UPI001AADE5A4|nr:dethiobiotin synthase [Spirabiliibacterium pneumoniae]MBE2896499.1 dethiobiotin synthase [Spirabiliibacterium pneumoniae]
MSCFFVTGTDSGVGKTVVSRAIIQAMQQQHCQIVGYKPVACNSHSFSYFNQINEENEQNADVLTLLESTQQAVNYQDINSYTLHAGQEPGIIDLLSQCQSIDINKINRDLDVLASRFESVLVEGSFGWKTPITQQLFFSDWVMQRKMPVVLVVGIKEGCINHALLTAESIVQCGVTLLGWVANRINPGISNYPAIIELLMKKLNAPLLGQIPYLHHPESKDLAHFITNHERLNYCRTVIS